MKVDIRRADERFKTSTNWLDSKHCFSFGYHYDARNTHHGLLLVSNDDIVQPNTGFSTHPHRDMEIVTWVLDGELEHTDTLGNKGIIYPGLAQRMSAGRGIWHSEINNTRGAQVHFVQMWVLPDTEQIDPSYEQLEIGNELDKGGLVPIASGRGHDAAISIRQQGAVLWGGRLKPGETVRVPENAYAHVYVAKGDAELENAGKLVKGDAVRLTAAGAPSLTAGSAGAEVLIWEMASGLEAN
ncbi:MAG TPA: pirin family protein [Chloroflexota bacterium]|nr:pirin family protein [Chloroflexota bacterium]